MLRRGVYANLHDIRATRKIALETPLLVAEPVEWLAEFRCFNHERLLTDRLYAAGQPVEWSTERTGLTQQGDRVRAELRTPSGRSNGAARTCAVAMECTATSGMI